jgi:predicted TIM-barrel fold metal-dependent hydrolase
VLKGKYPNRFIVNGAFDPRDGEAGLDRLDELSERYKIQGVKLYTAEWRGDSKGYKLSDPGVQRYFELRKAGYQEHPRPQGPDHPAAEPRCFRCCRRRRRATSFQNLNFIVEHCGLPRLDDFCWIATQETNVYGGLAVVLPFIHTRPEYFAHVISELLFWIGEDKILYGSDYGIWSPKWLIEKFMAFELPESVSKETGVQLSLTAKKKILGLNAARLYGIDIDAQKKLLADTRQTATV